MLLNETSTLCFLVQSSREIRTVCVGVQEATGSREPACVLCGCVDHDSSILGQKEEHSGFYFHLYCVKAANDLCQLGADNNSASFYLEDLIHTVRRAEQKLCCVCGKRGAFITCAESGCDHSFHLPCASEGECITWYFGDFRSFCWEHRPQQAVEAVPAQDMTCIICMDPVGDSRSYSTMVCPSCQHAWFHRACIQEQALCAGIYCFQCPLCRDRDCFTTDMLTAGIRIRFRRPTWEDNNAYASLGVRHQRCDASDCLNPHGRDWAEGEGCRTSESSRHSPELGYNRRCRQGQRARTRSRSPLQRRAPDSPSQPQIHRWSRQAPTPSAESCTHGYTTPRAPGCSGDSAAADGSRSRQPGRAWTRSRSPLEHRAAEIHSQPRRRRWSRSRWRGPPQGRNRSRAPLWAQNISSRP